MAVFECLVCGYVYDERTGKLFKNLPDDWTCPLCGAGKNEFKEKSATKKLNNEIQYDEELRELSSGELSFLFSNLAKGCQKQYRDEEAELFGELSRYYCCGEELLDNEEVSDLTDLLMKDIDELIPKAYALAAEKKDRGSLRALTWDEKVSRIINSIIGRYETKKDDFLLDSKVYVCEICGFIYIGNDLPDICPVCKVTNKKLLLVERG